MTYKGGVFLIIFSVKEGKSEKHQNKRYRATFVPHIALLTGTKLKMGVSLTLKKPYFILGLLLMRIINILVM